MFHRIDEIRVAPTVYIVAEGDLTAVPSELVRVFGPPTSEPFDRESLGAFYFRGADEQPFMLYFRAHDLGWWSMRKLRSTFWLGREAREFRISTLRGSDVSDFKAWVAAKLTGR
jgi:hypothetical protein